MSFDVLRASIVIENAHIDHTFYEDLKFYITYVYYESNDENNKKNRKFSYITVIMIAQFETIVQ